MIRTDWRVPPREPRLSPPDDGLDDEEREARADVIEREIDRRMDEMRDKED
jgi:hypothetical protein